MKRISVLLPLINSIGAVSTYFYFSFVLDSGVVQAHIPGYYSPLFFVIGTVVLISCFNIGSRRSVKTLFEIANGQTDIHSLEESEVYHLQR